MLYYLYDQTFEGLLTIVFEAFSRKEIPDKIVVQEDKTLLFTEFYYVTSDPAKSGRVLSALKKIISPQAIRMLFACYMSEIDGIEMHIYQYIRKTFLTGKSIEMNFADNDVLQLSKIFKKVTGEIHKVQQFVRFQKTVDGIFFACIEPVYNVLPFTASFFEDRFADQLWMIYDVKRNYALYYDLKKTEEVKFEDLKVDINTGKLTPEQADSTEMNYQELWRQYFSSAAIKERMNLKLQKQHMPERFWKYLTEKQ